MSADTKHRLQKLGLEYGPITLNFAQEFVEVVVANTSDPLRSMHATAGTLDRCLDAVERQAAFFGRRPLTGNQI